MADYSSMIQDWEDQSEPSSDEEQLASGSDYRLYGAGAAPLRVVAGDPGPVASPSLVSQALAPFQARKGPTPAQSVAFSKLKELAKTLNMDVAQVAPYAHGNGPCLARFSLHLFGAPSYGVLLHDIVRSRSPTRKVNGDQFLKALEDVFSFGRFHVSLPNAPRCVCGEGAPVVHLDGEGSDYVVRGEPNESIGYSKLKKPGEPGIFPLRPPHIYPLGSIKRSDIVTSRSPSLSTDHLASTGLPNLRDDYPPPVPPENQTKNFYDPLFTKDPRRWHDGPKGHLRSNGFLVGMWNEQLGRLVTLEDLGRVKQDVYVFDEGYTTGSPSTWRDESEESTYLNSLPHHPSQGPNFIGGFGTLGVEFINVLKHAIRIELACFSFTPAAKEFLKVHGRPFFSKKGAMMMIHLDWQLFIEVAPLLYEIIEYHRLHNYRTGRGDCNRNNFIVVTLLRFYGSTAHNHTKRLIASLYSVKGLLVSDKSGNSSANGQALGNLRNASSEDDHTTVYLEGTQEYDEVFQDNINRLASYQEHGYVVDNTLLDMSTGAAKKQADDDASALYFGQAASKAKKGAAQPPPALSTVPIQGYTSRAPDAAGIALHATTVIATTHRKSYAGPRRGRTICLVCGTRFDSAVLGTTDAPWVHHPASLCPAFTLLPGVNGLLVLGAHVEGTGERLVFDRDADAIERFAVKISVDGERYSLRAPLHLWYHALSADIPLANAALSFFNYMSSHLSTHPLYNFLSFTRSRFSKNWITLWGAAFVSVVKRGETTRELIVANRFDELVSYIKSGVSIKLGKEIASELSKIPGFDDYERKGHRFGPVGHAILAAAAPIKARIAARYPDAQDNPSLGFDLQLGRGLGSSPHGVYTTAQTVKAKIPNTAKRSDDKSAKSNKVKRPSKKPIKKSVQFKSLQSSDEEPANLKTKTVKRSDEAGPIRRARNKHRVEPYPSHEGESNAVASSSKHTLDDGIDLPRKKSRIRSIPRIVSPSPSPSPPPTLEDDAQSERIDVAGGEQRTFAPLALPTPPRPFETEQGHARGEQRTVTIPHLPTSPPTVQTPLPLTDRTLRGRPSGNVPTTAVNRPPTMFPLLFPALPVPLPSPLPALLSAGIFQFVRILSSRGRNFYVGNESARDDFDKLASNADLLLQTLLIPTLTGNLLGFVKDLATPPAAAGFATIIKSLFDEDQAVRFALTVPGATVQRVLLPFTHLDRSFLLGVLRMLTSSASRIRLVACSRSAGPLLVDTLKALRLEFKTEADAFVNVLAATVAERNLINELRQDQIGHFLVDCLVKRCAETMPTLPVKLVDELITGALGIGSTRGASMDAIPPGVLYAQRFIRYEIAYHLDAPATLKYDSPTCHMRTLNTFLEESGFSPPPQRAAPAPLPDHLPARPSQYLPVPSTVVATEPLSQADLFAAARESRSSNSNGAGRTDQGWLGAPRRGGRHDAGPGGSRGSPHFVENAVASDEADARSGMGSVQEDGGWTASPRGRGPQRGYDEHTRGRQLPFDSPRDRRGHSSLRRSASPSDRRFSNGAGPRRR